MKILLTGDYFYNYEEEHEDFKRLKLLISKYDMGVLNWEGSFEPRKKSRLKKAVNLNFSEIAIDLPKNSLLCLSNNHVHDFGQEGLDLTIAKIEEKGFNWFGLQSNSAIYDNYKIINIKNVKICFISFGCKREECITPGNSFKGVPHLEKSNIDNTLESIKDVNYDLLICYCHAGYEFEYYPLPLHVGLSRYLVDNGCDLVYFSHTHTFQPYEVYNGKHIFYGLGNFYFSSLRTFYPAVCDDGLAIEVDIQGKEIKGFKSIDIIFNRDSEKTTYNQKSDYFKNHVLGYSSLVEYSADYSKIRTRKKNPRPIMFYNKTISNTLKYIFWLSIVKITGFLGIRKFVKTLLGWN